MIIEKDYKLLTAKKDIIVYKIVNISSKKGIYVSPYYDAVYQLNETAYAEIEEYCGEFGSYFDSLEIFLEDSTTICSTILLTMSYLPPLNKKFK
jgi:repressor of nif and glnA expression